MSVLTQGTPVEEYNGILVKREDLCTLGTAGPPFSKMRGVIEHVAARRENTIGVLDTYHSQGGHAVAFACSVLGKQCVNYWPQRKADQGAELRPQQRAARELGAQLIELPAGRSAVLYHRAKADLGLADDTYMMPNALKLPEMITATAAEVMNTLEISAVERVIVSISSGTIAAGVLAGLGQAQWKGTVILHLGYDRTPHAVMSYMGRILRTALGSESARGHEHLCVRIVNEGYAYGDAVSYPTPFPSNKYYDAKAWKWLMENPTDTPTLFWNIGA